MKNTEFEMVRHIAAKAIVEDERVDVENAGPDEVEVPMIIAAHDAAKGTYISLD